MFFDGNSLVMMTNSAGEAVAATGPGI